MQECFFKYTPEYPAEIFSISLAFALLKTEKLYFTCALIDAQITVYYNIEKEILI